MIYLTSDRLRVEIALPGEDANTTCRFDRAGFISEVILDGSIRFAASEPRNMWHPCTGGRGFCNEFKADLTEDCPVGEEFPKLGVGLLPRKEGPHLFCSLYETVREFPVTFQTDGRQAEFITEPIPCRGYAMRTHKRIAVQGNEMVMEITAENVGEKVIQTEEYCHNFISIAGMCLGPDYRIEMPQLPDLGMEQCIDVNGKPCNWRANGRGFALQEYRPDISHITVDLSEIREDYLDWKLIHSGVRASVECREEYKPAGMVIWGTDHMISPEVFYGLHLEPGEKKQWRRVWHFDCWDMK